jgi:hypothetical protein
MLVAEQPLMQALRSHSNYPILDLGNLDYMMTMTVPVRTVETNGKIACPLEIVKFARKGWIYVNLTAKSPCMRESAFGIDLFCSLDMGSSSR